MDPRPLCTLQDLANDKIFEESMKRKAKWKDSEVHHQLSIKSCVSKLSRKISSDKTLSKNGASSTTIDQALSKHKSWLSTGKKPGNIGSEIAVVQEKSNNWQNSWNVKGLAGQAEDKPRAPWGSRSVHTTHGNSQSKLQLTDQKKDNHLSAGGYRWAATDKNDNSKSNKYFEPSNDAGKMKKDPDVLTYGNTRKKRRLIESTKNSENELKSKNERIEIKDQGLNRNQQSLDIVKHNVQDSLMTHKFSTMLQNKEKYDGKICNLSHTNELSKVIVNKNIVFADGIVLVNELFLERKQNFINGSENHRYPIPWPGRILGETECKDMFIKTGYRARPNDVLVWIYFPPPFFLGFGDSGSFDPQHQWKKLFCVHEMQLQPFLEFKKESIENYLCVTDDEVIKEMNVINLFWKAWTVASGLRKWACGTNLKKNDEDSESLNNQVGEYGAVLAIERYKWIEGSKEDDPNIIVKMIQNHKVSCFLHTYDPVLSEKILEKREKLGRKHNFVEKEASELESSQLPACEKESWINPSQEKTGSLIAENDKELYKKNTDTLLQPENQLKSSDLVEKYSKENENPITFQNEKSSKEFNNTLLSSGNDSNAIIAASPKCTLTKDNSKNENQHAHGTQKLEFVKVDGICLVAGKDETRSTHRPWPARIMCAKESLRWRSSQKKVGNIIPDDHVTVVYYFPFFAGISADSCTERWYSYSSVEPSRIFEFNENVSDISYSSDELYMRFMRGWIVAEGLQHWSYGINLQKPKNKAKGQEKINPIHLEVADYGFVLDIHEENWVCATQRLNPKDVVQMICDNEMIQSHTRTYDQSRADAILKKKDNQTYKYAYELSDVVNQTDNVSASKFVTSLNESAGKKKAVFHDLFNVIDESIGGRSLTNGEKEPTDKCVADITPSPVLSNDTVASIQSLDQKSITPLFRQFKEKVVTKESKDLYEQLECLSEKSNEVPSWIQQVLHLMSDRILDLEKEVLMSRRK